VSRDSWGVGEEKKEGGEVTSRVSGPPRCWDCLMELDSPDFSNGKASAKFAAAPRLLMQREGGEGGGIDLGGNVVSTR